MHSVYRRKMTNLTFSMCVTVLKNEICVSVSVQASSYLKILKRNIFLISQLCFFLDFFCTSFEFFQFLVVELVIGPIIKYMLSSVCVIMCLVQKKLLKILILILKKVIIYISKIMSKNARAVGQAPSVVIIMFVFRLFLQLSVFRHSPHRNQFFLNQK